MFGFIARPVSTEHMYILYSPGIEQWLCHQNSRTNALINPPSSSHNTGFRTWRLKPNLTATCHTWQQSSGLFFSTAAVALLFLFLLFSHIVFLSFYSIQNCPVFYFSPEKLRATYYPQIQDQACLISLFHPLIYRIYEH